MGYFVFNKMHFVPRRKVINVINPKSEKNKNKPREEWQPEHEEDELRKSQNNGFGNMMYSPRYDCYKFEVGADAPGFEMNFESTMSLRESVMKHKRGEEEQQGGQQGGEQNLQGQDGGPS